MSHKTAGSTNILYHKQNAQVHRRVRNTIDGRYIPQVFAICTYLRYQAPNKTIPTSCPPLAVYGTGIGYGFRQSCPPPSRLVPPFPRSRLSAASCSDRIHREMPANKKQNSFFYGMATMKRLSRANNTRRACGSLRCGQSLYAVAGIG